MITRLGFAWSGDIGCEQSSAVVRSTICATNRGVTMFRTATLASAVALLSLGLVAPASASPATPVCLITTSFGKETICAELLSRNAARATFHSLAAATLTVTLEYEPVVSDTGYVVLATKTVTGSGQLDITTTETAVPATGSVQACATAVESPAGKQFHLCTSH
jgi:hypothetical protein